MDYETILEKMYVDMAANIPNKDAKSTIYGREFLLGLVKSFPLLRKDYSLSDLHDGVTDSTGKEIHLTSFTDRMNTKLLVKRLKGVLEQLVRYQYKTDIKSHQKILEQIGVKKILGIDSSITSLWDSLSLKFPGTFTTAGIKLHCSINLLSGGFTWSDFSPASSHDVNHFLPYTQLKESLIVFDLGYWDFGLLKKITNADGYFLSRVKRNATFIIDEVKSGMRKRKKGSDLFTASPRLKTSNIIEVYVLVGSDKTKYRCLGFWNKQLKKYHWYLTNLECSSKFIREIYRLRWQIELSYKACKSHFNMGHLPSTKENTVVALILLAAICYQISCLIRLFAIQQGDSPEKIASATLLRAARITKHVIKNICSFLLEGKKNILLKIKDTLHLYKAKLYDPNSNKRFTTTQNLDRLTI